MSAALATLLSELNEQAARQGADLAKRRRNRSDIRIGSR